MIRSLFRFSAAALFVLTCVSTAAASEAELVLPDLSSQTFLGMNGRVLLMIGLVISLAGGVVGIMMEHPSQLFTSSRRPFASYYERRG